MKFILHFSDQRGNLFVCFADVPDEDDRLKGEIEYRAMILEMETGQPWVCVKAEPFPPKKEEPDET